MDKVHFSRCLHFPYPDKLFTFNYIYNEEDDEIVPEASHTIGTPSHNVNFRYWDVNPMLLSHLREKCSHLDRFELSGNPSITDNFLEALAFNFPSLRQLIISDCSVVTLRGVAVISEITSLTQLHLAGIDCIDDDCITMFSAHLTFLRDLDISRCSKVSNASLVTLAGSRCCKVLTHLSISSNPNITYRGTTQLLMYCTNLLYLDVSRCRSLEFLGVVVQIGEGMKQYASAKLRSLIVAHCPLNADSVAWISAALPDLETLDIRNVISINNPALQSILLGCSSLRKLCANNCDVSSTGVQVLATATCRATMTSLDLTGTKQLKGKVLREILCNTKLVDLYVNGVKGVTDNAFAGLPTLDIKRINISGCTVTSNGVVSLIENTPHLLSLSMMQLSSLEDAALVRISQCCVKLTHLDVTDCLKLTDTGISCVAQRCHGLVDLRIGTSVVKTNSWGGRVTQYTDKSLETILKSCPRLTTLDIHNQCGFMLTSPWFQNGFGGHFSLNRLNLFGCDALLPNNLAPFLAKCFYLEEVSLPHGVGGGFVSNEPLLRKTVSHLELSPEGEFMRTDEFWMAAFRHTRHTLHPPQHLPTDALGGLFPHPMRMVWRFRAAYIRRQLVESWAARKIQYYYKRSIVFRQLLRLNTARRIWRWHKYRKHQFYLAELRARQLAEQSALAIQRKFRSKYLPQVRAVVFAQKLFRGWMGRTLVSILRQKNRDATTIQKMVRGMLVRLSDHYVLGQIYLKLPEFWKNLLKAYPPKDPNDPAESYVEHISLESITEKRAQVQSLLHRIEYREPVSHSKSEESSLVLPSKKKEPKKRKLAAKLPFIVPQMFDKKPYVSLSDGRKMAFCGDMKSLMKDNGSNAVHQYNFTFWPAKPTVDDSGDTTLFNPHQNGFDVRQNQRETLHCQLCGLRLRVVECETCVKGYCFYCAFQMHLRPAKRKHTMSLMEPRIIKVKSISASLVYHLDQVQRTAYDIRYLVNFMKSKAEVKRIEAERKLAREMEELAAKRELEAQKAAQESQERHQASTRITCLIRAVNARLLVRAKRKQKQLEELIAQEQKVTAAITLMQRVYRGYSTRLCLSKFGVWWNAPKGKKRRRKKPVIGKQEKTPKEMANARRIAERCLYEVHQRRLNERKRLFAELHHQYCNLVQYLNANTRFWVAKFNTYPEKEMRVAEDIIRFDAEFQKQDMILTAGKTVMEARELEDLNALVKSLQFRRDMCRSRLDGIHIFKGWIGHHVRGNCRRLCVAKERFRDVMSRLEWITLEDFMVQRIQEHVQARINDLAKFPDLADAVMWYKQCYEYTELYRAKFDALQETIVTEECRRLDMEYKHSIEVDSLVSELLNAISMDAQYAAERVYLDSAAYRVAPNSDEAVSISERSLALKMKQSRLASSVIDQVKIGLDDKLEAEDDKNIDIASFPTDSIDLSVPEMPTTITAKLLETYEKKKHFDFKEFLNVILSQPWLAKQAIEDVHIEEKLRSIELQVDNLQTDLRALLLTIANLENDIKNGADMIQDLTVEIDNLQNQDDDDDDPVAQEERLATIATLELELKSRTAAKQLNETNLVRSQNMVPPLESRVEVVSNQLQQMREALELRREDRQRIVALYFDKEAELSLVMHRAVLAHLHDNAKVITATKEKQRYCETAAARGIGAQLVAHTEDMTADVTLEVSKYSQKYAIHDKLSEIFPEHYSTGAEFANVYSDLLGNLYNLDLEILAKMDEIYIHEEELLNDYQKERKHHEKSMELFLQSQIRMRRQRALQKEIYERLKRLDMLRETRLQATLELRRKNAAERKAAEDKKAEELAQQKPLLTIIAQNAKAGVRAAADGYRAYKERKANAMDREEERMAGTIRKRNKAGISGVTGIRKIHVTGTVEEMQQFQRQNDILFQKGLPYYRMMERGVGSAGDVFIWFEMTNDTAEFITHLDISHTDPKHELYKNLTTFGFEAVRNDNVKFVLWVKRERKKRRAIDAMRISYEVSEEKRFTVDGYEKIADGVSMSVFDLPDVYIWIHKVDKDDAPEATNTNALVAELKSVRKMLKSSPHDKHLIDLEKKLKEKLEASLIVEQEAEVTNPLEYAVEMLALDTAELSKWMKIFQKFDKGKTGHLDPDEIILACDEAPTQLTTHIFKTLDALDEHGTVEFGDFMRTFAIFCLFGKEEILRFLFTFADSAGEGELSHTDFVRLLNVLHPYDKKRTKRALMELDLSAKKKMDFNEFKRIDGILPTIMHPAFRIQHAMRVKTMGEDWWLNKLRKYHGVRQKLKNTKVNADEAAEREMARVAADEDRVKRMELRAAQITQTSSAFKRLILHARQLRDEFS